MPSPPTRTVRTLRGVAGVHSYLRDTLGLPIGRRAIERATKSGVLAHLEINGRFHYEEADVDDWVTSLKRGGLR